MGNACLFGAAQFKSADMAYISPVTKKCAATWRVTANSVRHLVMTLLVLLACYTVSARGQQEPDTRRKTEIMSALIAHGFHAENWLEAKRSMRGIAEAHGWQTKCVPDARVLIVLGLGNANSNPWVATQGKNHLDPAP